MIRDNNKGIAEIQYNHLNLPTKIIWSNNKYISYTYNAAGQKVQKRVVANDSVKVVDYLDGFQYAGGVLQFFPHAEGYVKATPAEAMPGSPPLSYIYNYVFNYTDHLGNVRLSYSKDPQTGVLEILDENHYYPFGLKHEVYVSANKKEFDLLIGGGIDGGIGEVALKEVLETEYLYKYNGKEFQDELNLNWYDYMARNYDPALGRWMNMDPLAEKFYPSSTYNYTVNNPILLNDPDGRDWSIKAKKDKDGNWQINITVNAAVVNNSGKEIDLDNYIKEQTAQFNRIFSFEGEGVSITANLNMRAISSEDDVQGSEHLIAIGDSKNFASDVGGHADYGGLRVDINGKFINKDGTTDYNNTLSHEIGHTGGLIHPFSNNEKVSFFSGYTWFGLKENRTEASIYKQKVGIDLSTNFMSYPQKYYKYNASTVQAQKLKNVLANPGRISGGQVGALIRYYSKGLLNKDNR
jgi:RHS repeat-associated protein